MVDEKYFSYIMEAVRQNLGLEADDISMDDEIAEMSKDEILSRVCNWNGLLNYGCTVREWVVDIWGIDLDDIIERHKKTYQEG